MSKVSAIAANPICQNANHDSQNGILWDKYMQNLLFAIKYSMIRRSIINFLYLWKFNQ